MAVWPAFIHSWDVSPAEAIRIQHQLRDQVVMERLHYQPETIAGVDVSIRKGRALAAVVLHSYPELVPLETAKADRLVSFPYIPGLLAFREGPAVLTALEQLGTQPDVLIFDAQGYAHPRRMGLATHLGVLLDIPSVGCAKSRLCGTHEEPGRQKGNWVPLIDNGELIGAVVRTRSSVRPVFVSVGHRMDLETAVSLVLNCATRYRLPEPTRWAHRLAGGGSLPPTRQSPTLDH